MPGSALYQIAMELSYLHGKHGSLSLRSIRSATGFHFLQGARSFSSDQYVEVANTTDKYARKQNPPEIISDENFDPIYRKRNTIVGIPRSDLFQDTKTNSIITEHVTSGRKWSDSQGSGPGTEVPMRMAEYPNSFILNGKYVKPPIQIRDDEHQDDFNFGVSEIVQAQNEWKEWSEKYNGVLKSKIYWIKQIQKNPILDAVLTKLKNNELELD